MRKTMVYLDEEQFLVLKKVAASSKKKASEIIREALTAYLKEKDKVDYFSFVGIAEGTKDGRTSAEAEDILKEFLR
ncbi:MAG: DNA-binding protein [Armatimonadetes bacterium]|nr:DNA-binding protein [Armatimonadota bacterium]